MEAIIKFLKATPEERAQGIVRFQAISDLGPLRQYIKGHEAEYYQAEFKYKNTRSLPQNARFHAIARDYAKAQGMTFEKAKATLKHEYGVVIPYLEGFTPPTRPGQFIEIYGGIEFQVSTAEYTKDEFAHLMDGVESQVYQHV